MRRIWASGVVLALVLGGIVVAADDDQPQQSGWGAHGVYRHKDKPVEKPAEKPKVDPEEAKQPAISFDQENNALYRRQAVVNKLRDIAEATHDTELAQQANDLDQKLNKLFQDRLKRLSSINADDKAVAAKRTARSGSKDTNAAPKEVNP